jgi:D-alanyl-D-alanine carboxypeptidase (penicillin-binding protein 5/6)
MALTLQAAPADHLDTVILTIQLRREDHPDPLGSCLQMTTLRYAVRALVLSLTLTAAGGLCAVDAASPAPAGNPALPAPASSNPVGGSQLAARGVIVNLAPGVPAPPAMPGASFLIADMDTGQILAARAPHARHLPASTLKTLTALTLIPILDRNTKIMVKPEDVRAVGSRLGILAGTSYSVGTLLQGLLMASGNDAAYALARGNHSTAATLKAMNATAAQLNAFDTRAKDPSGLDKAGQRSSAYDLALIGRAAMKLPDFRRYVMKKRAALPGGRSADGKLKPGFEISSHNKLLYNYRGAIGIKSGFTIAAQHTYIGAATRGGKTYIVTQMASPSGSWRPHAALLNWAFAHGASVSPIGDLVEPGSATSELTVKAGAQPKSPNPLSANSALLPAFPPWVGLASLIGAMALVVVGRRRHITRKRIARQRRTRS